MIQSRRVSAFLCIASALSLVAKGDLFDSDLFKGMNKIGKSVGMMQGLFKGFTSNKMVISPIKYSECPDFKSQDTFYVNYDTMGGENRLISKIIEKDEANVITVEGQVMKQMHLKDINIWV